MFPEKSILARRVPGCRPDFLDSALGVRCPRRSAELNACPLLACDGSGGSASGVPGFMTLYLHLRDNS